MSHRLTLLVSPQLADRLTERESEVMDMAHLRNPEIAAELHISESTVKRHLESAYLKLGAETRVGAALTWDRQRRRAA